MYITSSLVVVHITQTLVVVCRLHWFDAAGLRKLLQASFLKNTWLTPYKKNCIWDFTLNYFIKMLHKSLCKTGLQNVPSWQHTMMTPTIFLDNKWLLLCDNQGTMCCIFTKVMIFDLYIYTSFLLIKYLWTIAFGLYSAHATTFNSLIALRDEIK